MKTERAGTWWELPWYRKVARWLRVVPRADLIAAWKALWHDPSRCMAIHDPCPGPNCTFFSRRTAYSIRRNVRATRLEKFWRVVSWEEEGEA